MPPWALISSIAISAPIFLSCPWRAHRPESGATSAIFTSSAAGAGAGGTTTSKSRTRVTAIVWVRSDIGVSFRQGHRISGDGRDYSIRPADFSRSTASLERRRVGSGARPRSLYGERMKDVDRVADVQPLSEPARNRRARVDAQPLRVVPRAQRVDGVGGNDGGRRHVGQWSTIRSPDAQLGLLLGHGRRLRGNVGRKRSRGNVIQRLAGRLHLDTGAAPGPRGAWRSPWPPPSNRLAASRGRCARRARRCRPCRRRGVAASASASRGSAPSARATRSQALPGSSPTRHDSHSAHERCSSASPLRLPTLHRDFRALPAPPGQEIGARSAGRGGHAVNRRRQRCQAEFAPTT